MSSIVFFPCFLILCSLYTYFGNKYGNYCKNILIFILIAIYTFVLGVRVNFGTDQITYLHMYYYQGADLLRCERIFVLLNQFLRKFNAPYQVLFSVIAFLEIYFLILAFEKENVNIFYAFILFFLIYINLYLNLSRQAIAQSFILLSIVLFINKKYISWLIITLIATGFHISAVLSFFIVPILNIFKKIKFPNFVYYLLLFLSMIFYEKLFDVILQTFLIPLNIAFGEKVTIIEKVLEQKIPLGSGMGVRLRCLAYIFMLPLLLDFKKQSPANNLLFSLFYFGLVGEFFASVNMNLVRIFYYYTQTQLLIIPKIISSVKISNIKKLMVKEILFLIGLFFLFVLAVPKWISGADTTAFYKISLNFDLYSNHMF